MEISQIINHYDEEMDDLRMVTSDLRNAKDFSLTPKEFFAIQKKYNKLMGELKGIILILKDARDRDEKLQNNLKRLEALDEFEGKIYEIEKATDIPF